MAQQCTRCSDTHGTQKDRREFLTLALLGGGATLVSALLPQREAQAAGATEVLLLSCMDFRLIDETERYMARRGLKDKYDHIILAGASLGALTERYPSWGKMFWEHLEVAIQLHKVHKVMVMDHRDCGAYKVILGEDFAQDRSKERAVHTARLRQLAESIKASHPSLDVELLLMDLGGQVEVIT